MFMWQDGAPDPLNYQRLDTAAPQKLHFTVEQRLKCLCFHNYTKMSIYPHRPESMFYTVYLPTTSKSFLGTAKGHDFKCENFLYDELLTRSSRLEEMCLWTVIVYSKRELHF